jgi:hypothetical protein
LSRGSTLSRRQGGRADHEATLGPDDSRRLCESRSGRHDVVHEDDRPALDLGRSTAADRVGTGEVGGTLAVPEGRLVGEAATWSQHRQDRW